MKRKIGQLIIWYILLALVLDLRWDLIYLFNGDYEKVFGPASLILMITSKIAFVPYAILSYLLFYEYYPTRKLHKIISILIVAIPVIVGFRYLIQEVILPATLGFRNYTENYGAFNYLLDNLYYTILYYGLGIVFFFVQYAHFRDINQKNLLLQNQKTELAFLRSQVNPHFLFNILNNIYSLIYHGSDKALLSVEKLSGLMRYSLYEKAEKVPVAKEVSYLRDFIELQEMRYDYPLQLHLELENDLNEKLIPPFIFIPFVENAFKHGDLKNAEQPVRIELKKKGDFICFFVYNKKRKMRKDEVGGIGLQNVRKRLQLIYGPDHDLVVEETEDNFSIQLKIALDRC